MRSQPHTDDHAFPPFTRERLKQPRHVTISQSACRTVSVPREMLLGTAAHRGVTVEVAE